MRHFWRSYNTAAAKSRPFEGSTLNLYRIFAFLVSARATAVAVNVLVKQFFRRHMGGRKPIIAGVADYPRLPHIREQRRLGIIPVCRTVFWYRHPTVIPPARSRWSRRSMHVTQPSYSHFMYSRRSESIWSCASAEIGTGPSACTVALGRDTRRRYSVQMLCVSQSPPSSPAS